MIRIAIYPGSFNPFHEGHVDIVKKAARLFDEVYVVPSVNMDKRSDLNIDELVIDIKSKLPNDDHIKVVANKDKFTVEFAEGVGAQFIVRGLRTASDFEYELELYDGNKMLNPNIETIYLLTDIDKREVSSTIIRQIDSYRELLEESKKNSD